MIDRKPSHFGSKLSAPAGMSFTDLASIGATGGMTGRSIPPSWPGRGAGVRQPRPRARSGAAHLTRSRARASPKVVAMPAAQAPQPAPQASETEPDARYTFANERTFLAWTRTA